MKTKTQSTPAGNAGALVIKLLNITLPSWGFDIRKKIFLNVESLQFELGCHSPLFLIKLTNQQVVTVSATDDPVEFLVCGAVFILFKKKLLANFSHNKKFSAASFVITATLQLVNSLLAFDALIKSSNLIGSTFFKLSETLNLLKKGFTKSTGTSYHK